MHIDHDLTDWIELVHDQYIHDVAYSWSTENLIIPYNIRPDISGLILLETNLGFSVDVPRIFGWSWIRRARTMHIDHDLADWLN